MTPPSSPAQPGRRAVNRRALLRLGLAGAAALVGGGHTPYGQWVAYRQKHLLIGTSKADAASYDLGKRVAGLLGQYLPESKARVARGPDARRLASLISTGQIEVILVRRDEAADFAAGHGRFAPYGAVPLAALFDLGSHLLVSRDDFPDRHAYLVVGTLTAHQAEIPGTKPYDPAAGPLPIHAGARAVAADAPASGSARD